VWLAVIVAFAMVVCPYLGVEYNRRGLKEIHGIKTD
jgi:hypothetical protein